MVVIIAALILPTQVAAAPVFGDGFESGSLSAWSNGVRFNVQTDSVHSGTYAGLAASTGQSSFAWRSLTGTADVATQTWFNVAQRTTAVWLVGLRKPGGGTILLVGLDGKGRLIARDVVTATVFRSSTTVQSGVWQSLEVDATIGTQGTIGVALGGTTIPELSRPVNLGTSLIGRFAIGDPNSGRTFKVAFDDVAVADASSGGGGGDPATVGQWSTPFDIGVVGVHSVLLHTGKVLLFYRTETTLHTAQLFDPATGQVTDVSPPVSLQHDMFCSAHVVGPDGEVFVAGGLEWGSPKIGYGTELTALFDPDTGQWSAGPAMAVPRWYPTLATLPGGDSLIVAGDAQPGVQDGLMERFDFGTRSITPEPATATKTMLAYPRMFVLPDGRLIRVGQEQRAMFYEAKTSTWTAGPAMIAGSRIRGSYVLLPGLDRILAVGGAPTNNGVTTASTEILDLSSNTPVWKASGAMHQPRRNFNALLLPDGSVLAVGGNRGTSLYDDPVLSTESYDPATGTWTLMASQAVPRAYHSTAVLLPDGRVLSAGQTSGSQQTTAEIYSPPYLFAGSRPTISSTPQLLGYGDTFTITTPDAASIDDVELIRPGSVTHGVSFDQRSVSLSFSAGTGALTAHAPASGNVAPPGWYMVFILRNGVPSVASWTHLS